MYQSFISIQKYTFNLKDMIGQGYTSNVFKGKMKQPNNAQTQVAIKILPHTSQEGVLERKYIRDEIKVLEKLKGKQNIIQLFDYYEKQNNTYVITQFCKRGTLKKQLREKGRFQEQKAMNYFKQIVNGYRAIHQAELIHRDLKPDNILLKDKLNLKIADFGFAVNYEQAQNQTMLVGSQLYMPIQALKKNIYTQKNDMWALGIILFEMLTGDRPFKGKTTKQLLNQITYTPIKRIIPKSISEETSELIQLLLQTDYKQRISFKKLYEIVFQQKIQQNIQQIQHIKIKPQMSNTESNNKKNASTLQNVKSFDILPKRLKDNQILNQQKKRQIQGTNRVIKKQTQNTKQSQKGQQKKISDISISQIHLCRFAYKLLIRIKQLPAKNKLPQKFISLMTQFVFSNLQYISSFQFVSLDQARNFQKSKSHKKIIKIISQYQQRYSKQLQQTETKPIHKILKESINFCSVQVLSIYRSIQFLTDFDHCKQLIVVLDLLITFLQLIKLLFRNGVQSFHQNSKIALIADGKISNSVSFEHFQGIKNKLTTLKII